LALEPATPGKKKSARNRFSEQPSTITTPSPVSSTSTPSPPLMRIQRTTASLQQPAVTPPSPPPKNRTTLQMPSVPTPTPTQAQATLHVPVPPNATPTVADMSKIGPKKKQSFIRKTRSSPQKYVSKVSKDSPNLDEIFQNEGLDGLSDEIINERYQDEPDTSSLIRLMKKEILSLQLTNQKYAINDYKEKKKNWRQESCYH